MNLAARIVRTSSASNRPLWRGLAGHAKWQNVRHRKAKQDQNRSVIFERCYRAISAATKEGRSGNPKENLRLALAISQAKAASMPKDKIESAVQRGLGNYMNKDELEEVTFEGYYPGGIALWIACLTDNRNRAYSRIKYLFRIYSSSFVNKPGALSLVFTRTGELNYEVDSQESADAMVEAAVDLGAIDFEISERELGGYTVEILTKPNELGRIQSALDMTIETKPCNSSLNLRPNAMIEVEKESQSGKDLMELLNKLDDLVDVQNIYTNAKFM
mmetsp:Transcript_8507/g.25562  ORF Transcript_8507/g.25562 Transcript_8507/m.25562 type:complete len:274 (-) Transcript_8507:1505-2326(-)